MLASPPQQGALIAPGGAAGGQAQAAPQVQLGPQLQLQQVALLVMGAEAEAAAVGAPSALQQVGAAAAGAELSALGAEAQAHAGPQAQEGPQVQAAPQAQPAAEVEFGVEAMDFWSNLLFSRTTYMREKDTLTNFIHLFD